MSGGSVVIKKVKFEEEDNDDEILIDKTDQWVLNFQYDLNKSMESFLSDSTQNHRFYKLDESVIQENEIPNNPIAIDLVAEEKSICSKYGFEFKINRYVNYNNYNRMNLNDKRNLFFLAFALDPKHVAVRFQSKDWLKHFYYNSLLDLVIYDKNLVEFIRQYKTKRRCLVM